MTAPILTPEQIAEIRRRLIHPGLGVGTEIADSHEALRTERDALHERNLALHESLDKAEARLREAETLLRAYDALDDAARACGCGDCGLCDALAEIDAVRAKP